MDDDLTATYYVDDEMVEKIASGELSDRELGEMLFATVEMES
ncbi:hypothetical protein [Halomarina oriensis]|nr:hypothetical protein [Halomarina oriensis]